MGDNLFNQPPEFWLVRNKDFLSDDDDDDNNNNNNNYKDRHKEYGKDNKNIKHDFQRIGPLGRCFL